MTPYRWVNNLKFARMPEPYQVCIHLQNGELSGEDAATATEKVVESGGPQICIRRLTGIQDRWILT